MSLASLTVSPLNPNAAMFVPGVAAHVLAPVNFDRAPPQLSGFAFNVYAHPFHPCGLLPPSTPGTCDKIIDSVLPSDVGSCDLVSGGVHDDGSDRSAGLALTPRVAANCVPGTHP